MKIRSMLRKMLAAAAGVCVLSAMAAEKPAAKGSPKILIAFFSYSGNTRAAAAQIRKKVGGDIFEIKPAKAYPTNYKNCVAVAKKEIHAGHLPPLAEEIDISKYSIIFIGSPNWWGTIAPPVGTFIKNSSISCILGNNNSSWIVGVAVIPFHKNISVIGSGQQRDFSVDIVLAAACHGAHFRVVHTNGNSVLVFLAAKKQHSNGYDYRHQEKVVFHSG